MGEQIFYQAKSHDVMVTKARFVVRGETFAMQGVTSVRAEESVETPSKRGAIVVMGIGALAGLVGLSGSPLAVVIGLALVAGGVYWWTRLKDISTFHVVLRSASGEAKALPSQDEEFIRDVVSALNEALVARG